ncbi:hypothetical protein BGZ61DRAFT_189503 [Ilyonectria robusta]|uniref:uncharacterized protein n=1 Tax=Ilyonectria robusta TaxID=1079257 RepID=UPI001E8E9C8A|nr:uncharacterized protein BGZ61DRAFT_189503 [Ilyonectria robusta]KAH8656464.1 hypothetical protein BGZ61DRAFT_189503 [Ilyonectria robusta]
MVILDLLAQISSNLEETHFILHYNQLQPWRGLSSIQPARMPRRMVSEAPGTASRKRLNIKSNARHGRRQFAGRPTRHGPVLVSGGWRHVEQ